MKRKFKIIYRLFQFAAMFMEAVFIFTGCSQAVENSPEAELTVLPDLDPTPDTLPPKQPLPPTRVQTSYTAVALWRRDL